MIVYNAVFVRKGETDDYDESPPVVAVLSLDDEKVKEYEEGWIPVQDLNLVIDVLDTFDANWPVDFSVGDVEDWHPNPDEAIKKIIPYIFERLEK